MVCKITSTATNRVHCQGVTLIEMIFAVGIGAMVCAATIYLLMFSLRSYQAVTNFQNLNSKGRQAMDTLSTDIRQANGCSTNATFTSSSMTLLGVNPVTSASYTILYNYDSSKQTLTRTYTENANAQVASLLTNATYFAFSYYQRNPTNASFDVFPNMGTAATCKVIQVDWNCSRSILGTAVDTQSGESARIVIRKE